MAATKKKARKNSNYKPTYKYVTCDQLCRKTICDFRNLEAPREELGEKKEVDENLYNTAVEFCRVAGVITDSEKAEMFDGKNHVPMEKSEISNFTGIPEHQIGKNLFAFKIKNSEDFLRACMIKLALCDLITTMIQKAADEGTTLTDEEKTVAAGYINFCAYVGLISDEQSTIIYMMMKNNQPLDFATISSITGIDTETLQKMVQ